MTDLLAESAAGGHGADLDVLSGLHDVDELPLLPVLHGFGGDDGGDLLVSSVSTTVTNWPGQSMPS